MAYKNPEPKLDEIWKKRGMIIKSQKKYTLHL